MPNNNLGGGEIMIADEEFVSPVWNIEELKNEESDEADQVFTFYDQELGKMNRF